MWCSQMRNLCQVIAAKYVVTYVLIGSCVVITAGGASQEQVHPGEAGGVAAWSGYHTLQP